ncbi:MAG: hypothetical protein LPK80_05375 [Bacteroidota bacterium]|nr:hypothetical protein [Bacteroidota bacterium]MDX5429027.1 hypothetical protein [Bacteroidota bacterium]MDX5447802.1 hypothetical protein [Bacteroidota bacterium]MDX5506691.1 hypothetical protein [Bacteroidota bacterium]
MKRPSLLLFILTITLAVIGCRKDFNYSEKAVNLGFSSDTIFLDTVFTSIGSSTRILKVFNPTDENIIISRISLGRGPSSYYRINVNGTSSRDIKDVEILARDSIYIFVEVTADVMGANSLLYTDSIVFTTAGNLQDVKLVTLARDAYFHYPTNYFRIDQPDPFPDIVIPYSVLSCNETWSNDKPHVIYGYALVDSACTLTINPGTEVHFHNGSGLWVLPQGKLLIDPNKSGSLDNPVIIQGDRLEPFYENIPGQWGGVLGGIFISSGSTQNVINNTIIKNATTGLRIDSTGSTQRNMSLYNVMILNHSRVGIYGGFSNILAENLVVGNCGIYGFYALGGNYIFRHATFANYWFGGSRSTPTIGLFNFFEDGAGNRYVRNVEFAEFSNCIIWGNNFHEFGIGKDNSGLLTYQLNNSLIRIDKSSDDGSYDPPRFTNCILNNDPRLIDPQNYEFALDTLSPAMDNGNVNVGNLVPFDILGIKRDFNGIPDIGAYERIE